MSYNVSNLIGIRVGGLFSREVNLGEVKAVIGQIIVKMQQEHFDIDLGNLDYCISTELQGRKGSYVVIAGVFNRWTFDQSSEFVKRLSEAFSTEVMHMCWDEERDEVQCQIFLKGHPLLEVNEHPLGRMLRRIGS